VLIDTPVPLIDQVTVSLAVTVPNPVIPSFIELAILLEVIIGAVVSTTFTVRVAVPVLPEASVAVYVRVYVPTTDVFTLPVVVTVSLPLAVAPESVYEAPSSTVIGLVPVTVTIGAVVSTTLTVLLAYPVLPELSVALYAIVYDPTVEVFTVPVEVTVRVPSTASIAVAPASVYDAPSSTVAGLFPNTVITGTVVSGGDAFVGKAVLTGIVA
jgi:hypothetical protein